MPSRETAKDLPPTERLSSFGGGFLAVFAARNDTRQSSRASLWAGRALELGRILQQLLPRVRHTKFFCESLNIHPRGLAIGQKHFKGAGWKYKNVWSERREFCRLARK